ncbi:MAG: sporulation peptidase YabG [Clostridia bacterium]|nr:sporulation peptidase YabG [Clostridia bacterium]
MERIKKGDIVGRISYGKDVLFKIEKKVKTDTRRSSNIKGTN